MNRSDIATHFGVTPNTIKNWYQKMMLVIPKEFTQAHLSLLSSFRDLNAQEPPLEPNTIISMLMPLILTSNSEPADPATFPFEWGSGVQTQQQEGEDDGAGDELTSFITDSIHTVTVAMAPQAAAAFVVALSSREFKAKFRHHLTAFVHSGASRGALMLPLEADTVALTGYNDTQNQEEESPGLLSAQIPEELGEPPHNG